MTVRKIIKELTKLGKTHSEDDVACCLPDNSISYVVGTEPDEDGDVCICLDEVYEDSGCYNVEMLCNELQSYDQKAHVYMKGCGLLLGFEDHTCLFEYNEEEALKYIREDEFQMGKEEGIEQGELSKTRTVIRNMLKRGCPRKISVLWQNATKH